MNYEQVKQAALQYADKDKSSHVIANMDTFLRVVESRVNRILKVTKMVTRATVPLLAGQEYYGLPADFAGVRDVEIRTNLTSSDRTTLIYLNPEQMNALSSKSGVTLAYTIVADQIHIYPAQENKLMEITYYQRLPELSGTSGKTENWLSTYQPDAYIFGLLVEISSFLKDMESSQMWEQRFAASIQNIGKDDAVSRWSGTPLTIKVG